jgi:hypothetical protein
VENTFQDLPGHPFIYKRIVDGRRRLFSRHSKGAFCVYEMGRIETKQISVSLGEE